MVAFSSATPLHPNHRVAGPGFAEPRAQIFFTRRLASLRSESWSRSNKKYLLSAGTSKIAGLIDYKIKNSRRNGWTSFVGPLMKITYMYHYADTDCAL